MILDEHNHNTELWLNEDEDLNADKYNGNIMDQLLRSKPTSTTSTTNPTSPTTSTTTTTALPTPILNRSLNNLSNNSTIHRLDSTKINDFTHDESTSTSASTEILSSSTTTNSHNNDPNHIYVSENDIRKKKRRTFSKLSNEQINLINNINDNSNLNNNLNHPNHQNSSSINNNNKRQKMTNNKINMKFNEIDSDSEEEEKFTWN